MYSLMFVISVHLVSAQDGIGHVSYVGDKSYTFNITKEQYAKMPIWDKQDANPPLAARTAIKLTETIKNKVIADTDKIVWKLRFVVLNKINEEKWYWNVIYKADTLDVVTQGPNEQINFIVLMDGTVIEPKISLLKK